jgi:hypothetical protein
MDRMFFRGFLLLIISTFALVSVHCPDLSVQGSISWLSQPLA